VARAEAVRLSTTWASSGERVVVAGGYFDLLSVGHLRFLNQAKARGSRLIVVVFADRSAASLGSGRPVLAAEERARLVAALRGVDLVVVAERDEQGSLAGELGAVARLEAPLDVENAGVARIMAQRERP